MGIFSIFFGLTIAESTPFIRESSLLANLEIRASIPPPGINRFIASIRFERPVLRLYVASLPFIAILLLALALITCIPWMSPVLLK